MCVCAMVTTRFFYVYQNIVVKRRRRSRRRLRNKAWVWCGVVCFGLVFMEDVFCLVYSIRVWMNVGMVIEEKCNVLGLMNHRVCEMYVDVDAWHESVCVWGWLIKGIAWWVLELVCVCL